MLSVGSGEDAGFELTYGWFPYGRSLVFGWPPFRQPRECSLDGASLVLQQGAVTYRVARSTGILESVKIDRDKWATITLRECALDEGLDEGSVTLPAEAREAALDEETSQKNRVMFWASDRELGYARAHAALGERELDEAFLADWRAFLTALHRDAPSDQPAQELERLERSYATFADEIRSSLAADRTPGHREELRRNAAERRAEIEAATYDSSGLPAPRSVREPRAELLDAEREVATEIWRELVLTPALESFDREIARAFGE